MSQVNKILDFVSRSYKVELRDDEGRILAPTSNARELKAVADDLEYFDIRLFEDGKRIPGYIVIVDDEISDFSEKLPQAVVRRIEYIIDNDPHY